MSLKNRLKRDKYPKSKLKRSKYIIKVTRLRSAKNKVKLKRKILLKKRLRILLR